MQSVGFVEWLKGAINQKGVSYRHIAEYADISPSTIHNAIIGKYRPNSATCIKLAEYFKVDPDYVLELAGHRPPKPQAFDLADPRWDFVLRRIATQPPEDQAMILEIIIPIVQSTEGRRKTRPPRTKGA